MEKFYSKGFVCYLRASQMNDLIEKSVYGEFELDAIKKIASTYETIQSEFESRSIVEDNGLEVYSSLFSNEMFISYVQSNENETGITEAQLKYVLDDVCKVLSFFQKEEVTMEGGISYDEVYHSGNINIGPAIVKAVLTTQKGKKGIWLDDNILEFTKSNKLFDNYIIGGKLSE